MRRKPAKAWFVPRAVGFGWRPASWQGRLVSAGLIVVTVLAFVVVKSSSVRLVVIVIAAALYALVARTTSGKRETNRTAEEGDDEEPHSEPPAPAVARERPKSSTRRPVLSAGNGEVAIAVDRLTKRFGDRTAVDAISFAVGYGEVFGFLGPNGAGKTTTVRTLGTLIEPTSGSAVIAGIPLTPANGVAIRQRISIMPEAPGLYRRLTVTENLEFFAGLYGVPDSRSRIAAALDAVGLARRAGDPCGSLSKGLRQRVGLARALLNEPKIMFLDEPTSGLDPVAAREVHELVDGLRERGVTIFLTTHRLEEAERLCDRVGDPEPLAADDWAAG